MSGEEATPKPPTLRQRILAVLPALVLDLMLPYGVFFGASQLGASSTVALAAGGVLPLARTAYCKLTGRKVDGLALFIAVLFLLGVVLSLITGDPRFALAKESIFTALVGVACFVTLVVGRPLMFYVRREISPETHEQWETIWRDHPGIRRNLFLSTLAWGIGLVIESAAAIAVVYTYSTTEAAAISLGLNIGAIVVLMGITHLLGFTLRRQTNDALVGRQ